MKASPEIMVWGKTHPGENVAEAIVSLLAELNIRGITTGYVLDGDRRIPEGGINMQAAYKLAEKLACGEVNAHDLPTVVLEQAARAQRVIKTNQSYYATLDMHNSLGRCEDYASISTNRRFDRRFLGFLRHVLGLKDIVVSSFGMEAYTDNCALLEIDPHSSRANPAYWPERLKLLTTGPVREADSSDFTWWEWQADVTQVSARELGLDRLRLEPFDALPERAWQLAGGRPLNVVIHDNSGPNKDEWWGEVASPIPAPTLRLQ